MIKIGSKTLKTKNADGAWESFVASGITVDGEIDKSTRNSIANRAIAYCGVGEELEGNICSANIGSNADIDNIFEKEGN